MCQLAARRQDQGNVMMDGSQEPSNYNLKWEREKKKGRCLWDEDGRMMRTHRYVHGGFTESLSLNY